MAWLERWETKTVGVQPGVLGDLNTLEGVLVNGGWEPYAVTWGDGKFVYHLRRMVTCKEEKEKAPEIPVRKRRGY